MAETVVSATEANRSFARLLRRVRDGERVCITSHGHTVAVIAPPDGEADRKREEAIRTIQRRWADQPAVVVEPWTRDELYERESWQKWQR